MRSLRTLTVAAAMLATAAGTAEAQISFATTGRFTSATAGCSQLVASSSVTCAFGSFSLTYTGTTGTNIGNGSIASLGTFLLTGTGNQTITPGQVTFELFVAQTGPSVGSGTFTGPVTGTVFTAPSGNISTMMWSPNQMVNIGNTRYTIIYDNIGPAANRGLGLPINNDRGINALVTSSVVPEPSTYALMATGLAMLVGVTRRRKVS